MRYEIKVFEGDRKIRHFSTDDYFQALDVLDAYEDYYVGSRYHIEFTDLNFAG